MTVAVGEDALLAVIDRIYKSVERQELWPETIGAIGELIGGRRDLWGVEPSAEGSHVYMLGIGCHPTIFLSRNDLAALEQYAQDFGELIVHFLKIVFLSTLRPQSDVSARQAVALRMVQRFPQAFEPWGQSPESPPPKAAWRKLLAALWEDGRIFNRDNLRHMRLLAPHIDRALRLQMRLSAADLRVDMVSGAFDRLALGVAFVDRSGRSLWLNRRAQEISGRLERVASRFLQRARRAGPVGSEDVARADHGSGFWQETRSPGDRSRRRCEASPTPRSSAEVDWCVRSFHGNCVGRRLYHRPGPGRQTDCRFLATSVRPDLS